MKILQCFPQEAFRQFLNTTNNIIKKQEDQCKNLQPMRNAIDDLSSKSESMLIYILPLLLVSVIAFTLGLAAGVICAPTEHPAKIDKFLQRKIKKQQPRKNTNTMMQNGQNIQQETPNQPKIIRINKDPQFIPDNSNNLTYKSYKDNGMEAPNNIEIESQSLLNKTIQETTV